jgi:hypothetical protein
VANSASVRRWAATPGGTNADRMHGWASWGSAGERALP